MRHAHLSIYARSSQLLQGFDDLAYLDTMDEAALGKNAELLGMKRGHVCKFVDLMMMRRRHAAA